MKFGVWALFCYVGAEVSIIGTFLTNYIADLLKLYQKHRLIHMFSTTGAEYS